MSSQKPKSISLTQADFEQLATALSEATLSHRVGEFQVEFREIKQFSVNGVTLIQLKNSWQTMLFIAKPQSEKEYNFHARFQAALCSFQGVRVPELLGYAAGIGFMEYTPGPTLLEWLLRWRYAADPMTKIVPHLRAVAELHAYLVRTTQEAGTTTIRAFYEEQAKQLELDQFYATEVLSRIEKLLDRYDATGLLDRPFVRALVHGDFAPNNFIVTSDELILIDFTFSGVDLAIWDVASFFQGGGYPYDVYSLSEIGSAFRSIYDEIAPIALDDESWHLISLMHHTIRLRHAIQLTLRRFE